MFWPPSGCKTPDSRSRETTKWTFIVEVPRTIRVPQRGTHYVTIVRDFTFASVKKGMPSPCERFVCEAHTCSRFFSLTSGEPATHIPICAHPNAAAGSTRRNKRSSCKCIFCWRAPRSRTMHICNEKQPKSPCDGSQQLEPEATGYVATYVRAP